MNARTRLLTAGLTVVVALAIATAGCIGEIGAPPAPDEKVATLTFKANKNAALVPVGCMSPNDCELPNQHLCVQLVVNVFGDGHTVGTCWLATGKTVELKGTGAGIPLKCRSHTGQYAVHCLDTNNNVAVDGTGAGVAVYPTREPAWYRPSIGNNTLGDGAGYLVEPGPDTPSTPNDPQNPPGGDKPPEGPPGTPENPQPDPAKKAKDDQCRLDAIKSFNMAFQNAINAEGLTGINYQPVQPSNTSGFYGNGNYQNNAAQLCAVAKPGCKKKNHWSSFLGGMQYYGGGCYCALSNYGVTCFTSLLITAAKAQACNHRPQDCDANVWSNGVQDATVPAKQFVDKTNQDTDTKANVVEGIKAGATLLSLLGSLGSFGGSNNYGSPLVLDLEGDGIALTSAAAGVVFDLNNTGPLKTPWVAGKDDALLAIDLNGNGRIDSGAELFGDSSLVVGFAGGNGFQALARVDSPANGGNGNGLVEAEDVMYHQLVLWTDANRDGVSQASELTSLQAAGVHALSTTVESEDGVFDAHGNDLSTRGSFLKSDGCPGLMVDVFFLVP